MLWGDVWDDTALWTGQQPLLSLRRMWAPKELLFLCSKRTKSGKARILPPMAALGPGSPNGSPTYSPAAAVVPKGSTEPAKQTMFYLLPFPLLLLTPF